jgi:hypothetical protein
MKENSPEQTNTFYPKIDVNVQGSASHEQEPMSPSKYGLRVRKKRADSFSPTKRVLYREIRKVGMTGIGAQLEEIDELDTHKKRGGDLDEETIQTSKSIQEPKVSNRVKARLPDSEIDVDDFQIMESLDQTYSQTHTMRGMERSASQVSQWKGREKKRGERTVLTPVGKFSVCIYRILCLFPIRMYHIMM